MADLVERYREARDRGRVAAQRNHRGDARCAGARTRRRAGVHGHEALDARIAEAADARVASGAETVVGLVLAPHYSSMSIAGYREQLEAALGGRAELAFIESWHDEPGFVDLLAERVRGTDAHVVFTAHSLPARILDSGDPYKDQLLETSRLVAERGGARRLVVLVSERVADRRAVARAGHPRPPETLHAEASETCWSARSASSPTISRSAGTSTTRPRSGRRARDGLRADRDAERRPGVHQGARGLVRGCSRYPRRRDRPGEIAPSMPRGTSRSIRASARG